jgi:hypothetical protein
MPLPVVPKSLYPLVPFAPGIPAVLRSGAAILDAATLNKLGIGDALNSFLGSNAPKWGLYDTDGNPVVFADSVEAFDYNSGSSVSNYPIEGGKFSSYNKVANPYDIVLRMNCGSAIDNRVDFLVGLENAAASLELYTVVTPEFVYHDANVVSFNYRRESTSGANKIIADVHITEVRQVEASQFTNTKSDSAVGAVSLGQIQPVGDVDFDPGEFV